MDQQLVTTLTDPNSANCGDNGFNWPPNDACMHKVLIANDTGSVLAGGTNNPADTTGQAGAVGNTGQDWANEYNIHPEVRHPALASAHPADLRRRRRPRLRPPLPGAALPTVDRHGRDLGPIGGPGGRRRTPPTRCGRPAGYGTSHRSRTSAGTTGGAAPTRPGPRSRCCRLPWAGPTSKGCRRPGTANSLNTTATVKHFAGYSQSINGHDRNEALLPLSYLQDMILPSYAGGIDAGAGTVMVDSGSINGVPATASHYLLTDILRNQMGFQGVVISDYQDVPALQTAYHVAPDLAGAIAKAVNAGVDMSMEVFAPDQWQAAILQDVATKKISKARIDQAVGRILTLKFQMGLFDQACVNDPSTPCVNAGAADAAVTAGRDQTLNAAQESMTLLRNQNNALPLSPASHVVVTGPSADSMTNQLGGWSVSWQGVYGAGHVCCMGPPNQIPPGTTVKQGIMAEDPNAVYAPDQATAVADASHASAYVVAVGERAYAEGLGDNPSPQLAARPAGVDQRAGGDRQAGDRRRHRRPAARARAGRDRQRASSWPTKAAPRPVRP